MKSTLWKKKFLNSGLLYLILDQKVIDKAKINIFSLADKLAGYGVDIFQLRSKDLDDNLLLDLSKELSKIIRKRKKLFIVNDRTDIAYLSKASGLHLGKDDISATEARKILGKDKIIGKTTHSLKELLKFKNDDVDYLSIGPVFATKTKPKLTPLSNLQLTSMLGKVNKQIFAIGGINLYNVGSLFEKGIKNIAVCRDIILAKDLELQVKKYKKCLRKVS